jgi:23S rRNA (adenine2503-C2)-methyltransferase
MAGAKQSALLGLDIQELTALAQKQGHPDYRGRQLFEAIYRQRARSLDEITTLPRSFREALAKSYPISLPTIGECFLSIDGTVRYLIGFADGESVETVWMPDGDEGESGDGSDADTTLKPDAGGRQWERATICVSSQVGCAVDCKFCLTAQLSVRRNLTAGEIVGQVLQVLNDRGVDLERRRVNLVFMGQGEPLLNYDNFIKAVRLLVEGVGLPESRMTVSTAGIVPRIYDLGLETVRPKLAISLNAPNNDLRTQLMPINRKWNLESLMAVAHTCPLRNRERLTFEYVLLDQVNDSPQNAREVAELLRGMRAKVNLIAWNPGPGIEFRTPSGERVLAFQQVLVKAGIPTFIRRPRGRDIYAACGQLKQTVA